MKTSTGLMNPFAFSNSEVTTLSFDSISVWKSEDRIQKQKSVR
jgi:hypothetical protein